MSGADQLEARQAIASTIGEKFPALAGDASHVHVCTDTYAPIATACASGGGIVLIAGTGSNCTLVNPPPASAAGAAGDTNSLAAGTIVNCGGWGHMLGDEASGGCGGGGSGPALPRRLHAYTCLFHFSRQPMPSLARPSNTSLTGSTMFVFTDM